LGVEKACKEVAILIKSHFGSIKNQEEKLIAYRKWPAWHAFFGKSVNWTTLRDWYADYSPTAMKARSPENK
jgi:hypothetical protein